MSVLMSLWLSLGSLCLASAINVENLYPFNQEQDDRLSNGNLEKSRKVLSTPIKFCDEEFDYLWIHTDGYLSFAPGNEGVLTSDFPFNESLLLPFLLDFDTTNRGNIFFRETNDIDVLLRATADVRLAFPLSANDFDAESAVIVTWHDVEGRSLSGETATFTFQCVVISDYHNSYTVFLYPENKMGVVPQGQKRKSAIFQARAGFNQGADQYLEMYPVESLVDHRNTHRDGEWIFQIGGKNVQDYNEILAPERVRLAKRQIAVINVQDVNLSDDEEDDYVPPPRRLFDFCSRVQEPCVAENSKCVNFNRGFCCKCLPGYFGSGKTCLLEDEPVRVNGNISGVVDVKDSNDAVERVSLSAASLHSYVITVDGRAYTAVSGLNSKLGRALQPISTFGEVVGWLFASSTPSAPNGFQITGGNFQRRVQINFEEGGYRLAMTQRFLGVREENNVSVVVVDTKFVGMLPDIPEKSAVSMNTYEEDYARSAPGRISSKSARVYTVNDVEYRYNITQDIIYSECRDSMEGIPDLLRLHVSGLYLKYHEDDGNVRYSMDDKMLSQVSSDIPLHPCDAGSHSCHPQAECEPLEDFDFTCRCRQGFAGDGTTCEDLDECVQNPCPENAACLNEPGSYSCECDEGYEKNTETQACVRIECPGNQVFSQCAGCFTTCEERSRPKICTLQCRMQCTCPLNTFLYGDMCVTAEECPVEVQPLPSPCDRRENVCGVGNCVPDGESYSCECPVGYSFEEGACADVDECSGNLDNCADDARCSNTPGSFRCSCNVGFRGDGYTCESVVCPGNQVFSQCAGCFTTCEERSRPKICTLQCRMQCTCPINTFLNGDMCVTAEECPVEEVPLNPCISRENVCGVGTCFQDEESYYCECPVGYSFNERTCVDVDECSGNLDNCADDARCSNTPGSFRCSCNVGFRGDGYTCEAVDCPGNQVYSQCAGCFTTCEERSQPKICTLQCRMQCTCLPNTFLNGDMCVAADECPDSREKSQCEIEYAEVEEIIRENPNLQDGPEFPTCMPDGSFARKQCNSFTQVCWCVNPEYGTVVLNTMTEETPGNALNCDEPKQTPCREKYTEIERFHRQNPDVQDGPNYPSCTDDGLFSPKQCNGFTQSCWCVDPQSGDIIQGTLTPSYQGSSLVCKNGPETLPETACSREYARIEAYHQENPGLQDGPIYPDCTDDGLFEKKQCNGFTLSCWCVDPQSGDVLQDTRTLPGLGDGLTCENRPETLPETACSREYARIEAYHQENPGLQDGPIYPDCTDDGLFEKKQCNGFTLSCWCVDPQSGNVLQDTRTLPGLGDGLTCENRPEDLPETACSREYARIEAYHQENPGLQDGPIYPDCTDDGLFEKKQCNGFTLSCWCVDPQSGDVLQDTRTLPGLGDGLTCESLVTSNDQQPLCLKKLEEIRQFHRENPNIQDGPNFPKCSEDGLFAPKQCNDFTRSCWCVEVQTGTIIPNTMTPPDGGFLLSCDDVTSPVGQTACLQKYARIERYHRENPELQDGPIYPDCTEDGLFAKKQCNGFTQSCWCVDPQSGVIIINSRTLPDQGATLNCDDIPPSPAETACLREYARIEAYHQENPGVQDGPLYPDCNDDGLFEKKQCNGFTLSCWCVDPQSGDVLPNTMTLPDQGSTLSCDGPSQDIPNLTPCQQQKEDAKTAQSLGGSSLGPIFQPICTQAGAFEPIQYHPGGYYTCVDMEGEELSRHRTQPECLTQCQLQAYYAESDNRFLGTSTFVPQCTDDGSYSQVQCDASTRTCFCVDVGGVEIEGTRISTEATEAAAEELMACGQTNNITSQQNEGNPTQIIFAQSTSINAVTVPVTSSTTARKLYGRVGHTAVGVSFDCSSQKIFWTDVTSRSIFMSPISDPDASVRIVGTNIKSPEGVAVDFSSGNVYWTDSGKDTIEVAKTDGSNRAVLIATGLKNPRGLAVDPLGGHMYWTDWNRNDPKIMKANLDGSEATVFVSDEVRLPNDVAIDSFNRRLCFIDAGTRKVECMNLDGSGRSVVFDMASSSLPNARRPFGLTVDAGHIYFTDRRGDVLYVVDTATNEETRIAAPAGTRGHIYGITMAYSRCARGSSECSVNNGGCSHLCLPTPYGRTCKCPDNDSSCTSQ